MSEPFVVVVGGANVDVKARTSAPLVPETSNPGTVVRSPGGVGRNVAENLARLGTRTLLVSAVGDDEDGDWLLRRTTEAGVDVSGVRRTGSTGRYVALLDAAGDLVAGVADMAATDGLGPDLLDGVPFEDAALVVVDGNLPVATVAAVLERHRRVVLDPVGVAKAARLAPLLSAERPLFAVTPNREELAALGSEADLHARGVEVVWLRRGAAGSVLDTPDGRHELAAPATEVVDVTGAGDAMLAAFAHALLGGADLPAAAAYGHRAAALTVASPHTVRADLQARMTP